MVTNNSQNFNGRMIVELCVKWKIKHSNSSWYRPKMNDAIKATNKNIKMIMQKMVFTFKDWHEILPFTLHAYRTIIRTSIRATPYFLVYGMKVLIQLEAEISSLRVLIESKLKETDWVKMRYE